MLARCLLVVLCGVALNSASATATAGGTPGPAVTATTTTEGPELFEVINSGEIPLKVSSTCSHSLTQLNSTTYRLNVTIWKPACKINLYTDEPRLLRVKVISVPSYSYTDARTNMGRSTRLYRSSRAYTLPSSLVELSQTLHSSHYPYYQAYYKFRYNKLDMNITVVNQHCNKVVKMSASTSGTITPLSSVLKGWENCEIWAKAPKGSQISMNFTKSCKSQNSCSNGRVWVDTTKQVPHLYEDLDLVCPQYMPAARLTEGNTGAIYYEQNQGYLEGLKVTLTSKPIPA